MPLKIEVRNTAGQSPEWIQVGLMKAGEKAGSLPHNNPDGTREVYIFSCSPDGSKSTIFRSKFGVDLVDSATREVLPFAGLEIEKALKTGESHILNIKTDANPAGRTVRFTHFKTNDN